MLPRALAAAAAALVLALGPALAAHAAPVVSEVPGSGVVSAITEYQGLLYVGSNDGLAAFDGTTFTPIAGTPTQPRDFVQYLGDLWFIGGDVTVGEAALWRFDGTTATLIEPYATSPVVAGGRLYLELGDGGGDRELAWHDGTATQPLPGSPTDVSWLVVDPNGEVAFASGPTPAFWTYDATNGFDEKTPSATVPEDVNGLATVSAGVAFRARAFGTGDPDTAHLWNGASFVRLGAPGGGAVGPACFLEAGGRLYYLGNDGSVRLFVADPAVAGSEAAVAPTIPSGCPRYLASDGTLYLQAQGTGGNPTLHTWDGSMLVELDSVADFPSRFVEYGGRLYFSAQAVSETPTLFVLQDVSTPTGPTLPPTGADVSPIALAIGALLVAAGIGMLRLDRRRAA